MAGSELTVLKNLGTKRAQALCDAGICTLSDLARCFPRAYRDLDDIRPIAQTSFERHDVIQGRISGRVDKAFFGRMCIVRARIEDASGSLIAVWYNQPWLASQLSTGQVLKLYGRAEYRRGVKQMLSPQICHGHGIEPLYRKINGVPDAMLRTWIAAAAQREAAEMPEMLPEELRARHGLCTYAQAILQAHAPESRQSLAQAKRYLAFEQLLIYQLALGSMRARGEGGAVIDADMKELDEYISSWPFAPTGAQKRVISAIARDMAAPAPMARLVQGDVGCGKTAVAFAAIYLAARAGWQSALMAPTEVLARQHYENALRELEPLGVKCALLTGSVTGAKRRELLKSLADGSCLLAIGTHALISEGVKYAHLGLVVTDEQHRFGVRQRTLLSEKGQSPNTLVMSATPIPRTLALVIYGDLDVSVIDELPPGRTPVRTHIVPEHKLDGLYGFVRARVAEGRQAYFVCPLVEDSEETEATSAEALFEELRTRRLRGLNIELVHGRMRPAEKDAALERFRSGETQVLVSTTVIEVGVNVPNASVMVIVNAERFGLSQLHQLRGRVGRGSFESYCFLLAERCDRLDGFCRTNDGFEIARQDLAQRGAGEPMGARQSGMDELMNGLMSAGPELIEETHEEARRLLRDPSPEAAKLILEARRTFEKDAVKYGVN